MQSDPPVYCALFDGLDTCRQLSYEFRVSGHLSLHLHPPRLLPVLARPQAPPECQGYRR